MWRAAWADVEAGLQDSCLPRGCLWGWGGRGDLLSPDWVLLVIHRWSLSTLCVPGAMWALGFTEKEDHDGTKTWRM